MVKRIVASVAGVLALVAGLICTFAAVEIFQDFPDPNTPLWFKVPGALLVCGMALAALLIGARFLAFAVRGRERQQKDSLARAIVLGIGCFIPGFVFSLPLTIPLAIHVIWPGEPQGDLGALPISLCIGAATAVVSCLVLIKKRNARHVQI